MRYLIFILILACCLVSGCNNSQQRSNPISHGFPSDTVWRITKGQHKSDVRNILLQQGFKVDEKSVENSIIGIAKSSFDWGGADWSVVNCEFDEDNNLSAVSLMREDKISGDSIYLAIIELQRIFGEAKCLSPDKWQFINTHHINASITSDKNTILNIVWE